ncbi:MAG: hypothetical protein Q9M31_02510, partial [Mariprofundus sp.]|nr:hypothetical protein [Mariprofundus sp.]
RRERAWVRGQLFDEAFSIFIGKPSCVNRKMKDAGYLLQFRSHFLVFYRDSSMDCPSHAFAGGRFSTAMMGVMLKSHFFYFLNQDCRAARQRCLLLCGETSSVFSPQQCA